MSDIGMAVKSSGIDRMKKDTEGVPHHHPEVLLIDNGRFAAASGHCLPRFFDDMTGSFDNDGATFGADRILVLARNVA